MKIALRQPFLFLSFLLVGTPALALQGGSLANPADRVYESSVFLRRVYKTETKPDSMAICSGTILSERHILTAAHCLANGSQLNLITLKPAELYFVFGNTTAEESPASERRSILRYMTHPQYAGFIENMYGTKELNDIAVIEFEGGLPEGFKPVQILKTTEELRKGTQAVLAGYGRAFYEDLEGPYILKTATVEILGLESLKDRWVKVPNKENPYGRAKEVHLPPFQSRKRIQLVTGDIRMTHGDSGGPAYFEKDGTLYQWGVASSGGVYEMIMPHWEWIKSVTKLK